MGPFHRFKIRRGATRRNRGVMFEFRMERLGENFRKQMEPACVCCGYDAVWIIKVGNLQRFFCDPHMRDALLDAMNFNVQVPDSLPSG